jgi:hypothetical protein
MKPSFAVKTTKESVLTDLFAWIAFLVVAVVVVEVAAALVAVVVVVVVCVLASVVDMRACTRM